MTNMTVHKHVDCRKVNINLFSLLCLRQPNRLQRKLSEFLNYENYWHDYEEKYIKYYDIEDLPEIYTKILSDSQKNL